MEIKQIGLVGFAVLYAKNNPSQKIEFMRLFILFFTLPNYVAIHMIIGFFSLEGGGEFILFCHNFTAYLLLRILKERFIGREEEGYCPNLRLDYVHGYVFSSNIEIVFFL